jgi:hypothetical protein
MESTPAKPIFVVGSPRSGTSVLTWCLGQHPNIFPVPESNWMGDFAVDVAKSYRVGAARDNLSILSAMGITSVAFFANFGQNINDLILAHRSVLEEKRKLDPSSKRKHAALGPNLRWVDGTPEYSFHICGLRKLFPTALFVHLVRDVDSVVRSLLNFHRVTGAQLVATEEEAYKYWLRTVNACLKAEQAYGPKVVYRLLYSTLIENPEAAIRSLLGFVGEPYSAACLEPLGERINSSNVPAAFKSDNSATDPAIVEEARRLWAEIEGTVQPKEPSTAAADELENAFQQSYLRAMTIEHEIVKQAEQYTTALANLKQRCTDRLQQLAMMLDEIAITAATLRSSRFWTFANRAAAIEAKLFRNRAVVPDRAFRRILDKYSRWRASHPQIGNLHERIEGAESPSHANSSNTKVERFSESPGTSKISGDSAKA